MTEALMGRAIELSRRGQPAPNPHVGCVIAHGGEIVGEGWHEAAGRDHAEVAALKKAGGRAEGADAYVTLEPCSHHGRTPPCADALVHAGIRRVYIACPDLNPRGAGGANALRAAGIEVAEGLLHDEAAAQNEVFHTAMALERPYVCLKAAITRDGFLARSDGSSKWITSEESRTEGHRLRLEMGSVLVGRGTVEIDDPRLTVRHVDAINQPLKVILDGRRSLAGTEQVFEHGNALWITGQAPESGSERMADVEEGRITPESALQILRKEGMVGVLIEGGSAVHSAFLEAGLVDRIELFVGPESFGSGLSWPGGPMGEFLTRWGFEIVRSDKCGVDEWLTFRQKCRKSTGTFLREKASN
jgi:diaminohydroxyphosphoribosylaminopyrimidine deaminase/5-amino-6-(5-phosphoribosylamino)uracil reductase